MTYDNLMYKRVASLDSHRNVSVQVSSTYHSMYMKFFYNKSSKTNHKRLRF